MDALKLQQLVERYEAFSKRINILTGAAVIHFKNNPDLEKACEDMWDAQIGFEEILFDLEFPETE